MCIFLHIKGSERVIISCYRGYHRYDAVFREMLPDNMRGGSKADGMAVLCYSPVKVVYVIEVIPIRLEEEEKTKEKAKDSQRLEKQK